MPYKDPEKRREMGRIFQQRWRERHRHPRVPVPCPPRICQGCGVTYYRRPEQQPVKFNSSLFHNSACHHAYRTRVSAARDADAAGRRAARRLYADQPCEECGAQGERHHIDSNRMNNAPANIAFLCKKHHKDAHRLSDGKIGGGPRPRIAALRRDRALAMAIEARRLRAQGFLIREIADRLGVHPVSVERWFRKYPETDAA